MWTLIFKDILANSGRMWKLYLTNTVSILVIVLLYSLIAGASRQMDLLATVFSGDVTVKARMVPQSFEKEHFEREILPSVQDEDEEFFSSAWLPNDAGTRYGLRKGLNEDERFRIQEILKSAPFRRIPADFEEQLRAGIPTYEFMTRKLHIGVTFTAGKSGSIAAELIGVEFERDMKLTGYLSVLEGRFPANEREIMIPSLLLETADLGIGDTVRVEGRTSSRTFNRATYRICGIYRSPGITISLFTPSRLLVTYRAAGDFFKPSEGDIEYCLFFRDGVFPDDVNLKIRNAAGDESSNRIAEVLTRHVTMMDVLNPSVQFNVFLVVLVAITILVIFTVVVLVNFNFSLIMFRKRKPEFGTLLSFGTAPWKICLAMYLESIVELVLCSAAAVVLAYLASAFGRRQLAGGLAESLFVLLSGTNRIDFFIKGEHILNAVLIAFAGITAAQLPLLLKMLRTSPVAIMRRDE